MANGTRRFRWTICIGGCLLLATACTSDPGIPSEDAGAGCGICPAVQHCDEATGTCVPGCIEDANCPVSRPVCTPSSTCVRCIDASDCGSPAPACVDNECVECGDDTDCTDPDAAKCGADNRCVECDTDEDCPMTAPVCDASTRTCGRCTSSDECARFSPDAGVCHLQRCVQCAPASQAEDCSGSLCMHDECTTERLGELARCRPCETSADCAAGLECFSWGRHGVTGKFCLAPYTGSDCVEPFGESVFGPYPSPEGSLYDRVCVPPLETTCPGWYDAETHRPCETADDCGANHADDGLCAGDDTSRPNTCGYESYILGDCLPGEPEAGGICLP